MDNRLAGKGRFDNVVTIINHEHDQRHADTSSVDGIQLMDRSGISMNKSQSAYDLKYTAEQRFAHAQFVYESHLVTCDGSSMNKSHFRYYVELAVDQ
jgi:hypothetical protein